MELIISTEITLTDEMPQASHGNPVAVLTLGAIRIVTGPHWPIKVGAEWTTPASHVMNWIESAVGTLDDRTFAAKFINPGYTTPAP